MKERVVKTSVGWVPQVKIFDGWAGVTSSYKLLYDEEEQLISCSQNKEATAEYVLEQYKKRQEDIALLSSN